ncbi:MAG: YifB family Mg chelatase-like AAA ATPase, partial [Pseudomonadota bacterium]
MALARVHARALVGVEARPVSVEVDIAGGLPAFNLVGLPETAVRESRDRVRSAIQNAGFEFPQRRITVSLAPADLPKEGSRFDLPIALGLLAASGQIPNQVLSNREFAGELSLGGELRDVPGALPATLAATDKNRTIVLPRACAAEAALVAGADIRISDSLIGVVKWLRGLDELASAEPVATASPRFPDMQDVLGQHLARRAIELAAAGGHNLLMVGPPGSGKSMLASRLPGLLPPLDTPTALASAAVQSVSRAGFDPASWAAPPFRCPHHTVSGVALVGGGALASPGEISLAHGGVLFLDELAEFPRAVLDVLREPMESGVIHIARARRQATYPAAFQLVAAMNPCPCGYFGDGARTCRCTAEQVQRYQSRLSGPLLDRIDLHVVVAAANYASLQREAKSERSADIKARVIAARALQFERQRCLNAQLPVSDLDRVCAIGADANA